MFKWLEQLLIPNTDVCCGKCASLSDDVFCLDPDCECHTDPEFWNDTEDSVEDEDDVMD